MIDTPSPQISTEEIPVPLDSEANPELLALEVNPEPPGDIPGIVKKKIPVPVYKYPVVHDHFMGNCNGTLNVTRDTLSYISENEKCNFNLSSVDFVYSLIQDQLEIKTESKNYHFRSTSAPTKEENQSQLQAIFQSISKFHQ